MVRNVHARILDKPPAKAGELIDRLGSAGDMLWPVRDWPPMTFDGPMSAGTRGRHGPVCYFVEDYEAGRHVVFRFTRPTGFDGTHRFEVEDAGQGRSLLRHVLEMAPRGAARLTWPLVFRPLHDALIEDALDRAEEFAGTTPAHRAWSPWVKLLRWALGAQRRSRS